MFSHFGGKNACERTKKFHKFPELPKKESFNMLRLRSTSTRNCYYINHVHFASSAHIDVVGWQCCQMSCLNRRLNVFTFHSLLICFYSKFSYWNYLVQHDMFFYIWCNVFVRFNMFSGKQQQIFTNKKYLVLSLGKMK